MVAGGLVRTDHLEPGAGTHHVLDRAVFRVRNHRVFGSECHDHRLSAVADTFIPGRSRAALGQGLTRVPEPARIALRLLAGHGSTPPAPDLLAGPAGSRRSPGATCRKTTASARTTSAGWLDAALTGLHGLIAGIVLRIQPARAAGPITIDLRRLRRT